MYIFNNYNKQLLEIRYLLLPRNLLDLIIGYKEKRYFILPIYLFYTVFEDYKYTYMLCVTYMFT